jgi:hypothetical protein
MLKINISARRTASAHVSRIRPGMACSSRVLCLLGTYFLLDRPRILTLTDLHTVGYFALSPTKLLPCEPRTPPSKSN